MSPNPTRPPTITRPTLTATGDPCPAGSCWRPAQCGPDYCHREHQAMVRGGPAMRVEWDDNGIPEVQNRATS